MSDKPICLVTAPVATRSGYGAHSRDICRSLIKLDRYDGYIKLIGFASSGSQEFNGYCKRFNKIF